MKKIFFLIIALTTVLVSCEKKYDLSLQYKVLKAEAQPNDLWLFSMGNHLLGIDPVTFEEKLDVEFNYYITDPLYVDNKIYIAERSSIYSNIGSSIWGYNVICLNENYTLNCEISVHPNTSSLNKSGNYLVSDTYCYGFDKETGNLYSGFAIVDLTTNKCVYKNESLSDIISNPRGSWSYKNRLFLGTYPQLGTDTFAISVFNLDTMEFDALNSRIFSSNPDEENLKYEYAFININDNQLWINYYYYHTICVYDLDTYDPENQTCERIAKIDLKKDYNIPELANEPEATDIEYDFENYLQIGGTGGIYRIQTGQFINGKYHVVIHPENYENYNGTALNAILVIDPTTFELEKQINIKSDSIDTYLVGVDEIKYSTADEDILILRHFDNRIESYDANTGELLDQKIVFQEYE